MTRRSALAAWGAPWLRGLAQSRKERLNVLWIIGDDLGPQLGCYGNRLVHTPNADALAEQGVRFTHCFTPAPVCSASRSAWNTGVYQTTTGTHNHRSHRRDGYRLPTTVRLVSHRMREAGYFTANVLEIADGVRGSGKTDFNFQLEEKPFEGTHWNQRAPGQPFFAQINFTAPHKGPMWQLARKQARLVDPQKVDLPPYYPDHPAVRDEVANYLEAVNLWDQQLGAVVRALRRDGLFDRTVIFVFGDNGRCLLRGKQWLYDPGTHVPLLVRWPGVTKAGAVRQDLVSALDIAATTLEIAGIPRPELFHGQSLFSSPHPRQFVFTARDRCDMTVDRIRAVRNHRYKLIRNFMPDRPYTQYNEYISKNYPTQVVMKELYAKGKLDPVQAQWMAQRKPEWELYDLQQDPHEVRNFIGQPEHAATFKRLRRVLEQWIEETNDQGRIPESQETIEREEPRARKRPGPNLG